MTHRYLPALALLLLSAPAAGAESLLRYRVELLILHHLDATADPLQEPVFRDFSGALDLRAPPPETNVDESVPADGEPGAPDSEAATGTTPPVGAANCPDADEAQLADSGFGEIVEETEPAPPAYDETPGDTMQEAWRRLRLSAGFRPVLYFSWDQDAESEPFPLLRVHDDELVYVDDPWADQRHALREAALAEDELSEDELSEGERDAAARAEGPENRVAETGAVAGDTPAGPVEEPVPVMDSGPGEDPCLVPPEPEAEPDPESLLPDPRRFFRIDGTARLRRSRFLHLELELEWRDPVFPESPYTETPFAAAPPVPSLPATGADPEADDPAGPGPFPAAPEFVRVFRLKQSRQVRTEQLEYFDGPYFGVLAVISSFEATGNESVAPPAEVP